MARSPRAQSATITVKGSDTMVVLGQRWAEHYSRLRPGTTIQVTGGGSGTGFAALQNRQTDVALASRRIQPAEIEGCIRSFHRAPLEWPVAMDCIKVYVNAGNPVTSLSLGELREIYTGRITRWNQVGGHDSLIVLYGRESSSGTYEFFKERVLNGRDFSARTQTLAGSAQVALQVASDPNGIGFGGSAPARGLRHLRISREKGEPGVEPSSANVVSQAYPIWRYLFVYTEPARAGGEIDRYIQWLRGDEGQWIAQQSGFYPLPAELRPHHRP